MFEICDYNEEKGLIGVIDWKDKVVEWYTEKDLSDLCSRYKVKIKGYSNGMILYPIRAEVDERSTDSVYAILNPPKFLLDIFKKKGFKYNPSKVLFVQVTTQYFRYNEVDYLVYFEQSSEYDYFQANDSVLDYFYKRTGISIIDFCNDLLSNDSLYFRKYFS